MLVLVIKIKLSQKKEKKKKMKENIEYSKEWLTREIIKTDFEQKKNGQVQYVRMRKIDLLNLVLKFVKLNERGE